MKSCVRSHLDYGDIMYDYTFSVPFYAKVEPAKYNAELTILIEIRHSSWEKLCQE